MRVWTSLNSIHQSEYKNEIVLINLSKIECKIHVVDRGFALLEHYFENCNIQMSVILYQFPPFSFFSGNDFMCGTNKIIYKRLKNKDALRFCARELTLRYWLPTSVATIVTRNCALICTVVIPLSGYRDFVPHYHLWRLKEQTCIYSYFVSRRPRVYYMYLCL